MVTPLILIGVPAFNPCAVAVVTVTTVVGLLPSPDSILEILTGSAANAPTISHSGLCLENPSASAGYFSLIPLSLPAELL